MRACPNCGEENPKRARFCSSCGVGLDETPRRAAEERKIVSVLFVDLVGFTATSEKADPEDVRARLRPYHARVKQEIERFGGTVEKFVGDAVMAVFGAPVSHEDDAERAVSAALRILAAIDELNAEHPDLELAVRGAVNSGEAMVTLSARPAEGEGMVAGDVVNTAARLQQHAPVGGIVVGEGTYRVTRELFEYEPLEPVTAKGKGEVLQLWHATAPRRRFGVDVEPIVQTPLIGRDDDLALLQSTYARTLRDASTQLLTITGEPGVGKTRLTAEFRRWVDDQSEIVFWRQGRSLPYGEGITYWALGEMIKAQAGILESDSPEDAAAKLAVAVGEVAEDETEVDWLEATLAPLVGASGTVASSEREESFTAWRRFVEGIAAQRPLVLVFEDLHWADEALLAFIEHLVDWSTGVPLLVLCTARPELYERHAGWGGGKRNSNTVSLSPLAADDTARLLAALLHKAVLPAETQARLLEQAGGNPLYAEEFVRMLTDQGVIADGGGLVDGDIRVPDTVQALIAARLDTLPPERKTLLHDASVVGKVFWTGIVAEMGDRDDSAARAGLHELARKELVRAARTSSVKDQAEYSFWHALVRDVAYSQIPRAERAQKHIAAAEWIERMAGERVTDHAELLAHHYTQALDLTRAVGTAAGDELERAARRFLVLAGDRAMSLDLEKANSYYRRALELFGTDELERGNVLMKLVDTRQGSIEDAETALLEALALFRAHGNEIREGAALRELGQWAYLQGDGERSRQLQSEAIELLERHPAGEELASALTRRAGTFAVATQPHEALVATEAALRVVDELDLPRLRARLLQYRGIARHDLGDIGDGVQDIRAGLELGREQGDLSTVGIGYSNLASVLLSRSAQESADAYREGIDFTKARGMNGNARWLMAEHTWPLYDLGRWDEIVRDADILFEAGLGRGYLTIIALTQKALVLVQRGRTEEAAPLVDDVLPRAREAKDLQVLVPALATAAALAVAAGQLGSAAALVREAEEITREGAAALRARHLPDLVSIAFLAGVSDTANSFLDANYFDAGRPAHAMVAARAVVAEFNDKSAEAVELYEDAAARWSEYGSVLERANALFGAGRSLLALGRPHEATARLQEARTLYQDLGAAPSVGRVDEALARATSVSA
jgi:class 3 adenylate cyclase/tetratricopeptide (TPR) repeat protein